MRPNLLLFVIMVALLPLAVFAQLSGNYTIDPSLAASSTNFLNFTAAVNALNTQGVSGPVTITAAPGTYSNETWPIQINAVVGASATNRITLRGSGIVNIQYPYIDNGNLSIVKLNGADYITLDSLSITAGLDGVNFTSVRYAIWLCQVSPTNGCQYNIIRNCSILNGRCTNTVGVPTYGVYADEVYTPTSVEGANSYNSILDCNIDRAGTAIALFSMSCSNSNFRSQDNEIGSTSTDINAINRLRLGRYYGIGHVDGATSGGIHFTNQQNIRIHDCEISNGTSDGHLFGIRVGSIYGRENYISRNRISNFHHSLSSKLIAMIWFSGGDETAQVFVDNNSIYNFSPTTVMPLELYPELSAYLPHGGIVVYGVACRMTLKICYNSIYANNYLGGRYASNIYIGASNAHIRIYNNILTNTLSEGYVITNGTTSYGSFFSDYNCYDIPNGGRFLKSNDVEYYSMAALQNQTVYEQHSISGNPYFVSSDNRHIQTNMHSIVSNAGLPIPEITHDIDGDTRSTIHPDIGFDEGTFTGGAKITTTERGSGNLYSFPTTDYLHPVDHTFKLVNIGDSGPANLTFSQLTTPFSFVSSLPTSIPLNDSASITVRFTPIVGGVDQTATVSIGNQNAGEPPYQLSVWGWGVQADLNVTSQPDSSWFNFGNVNVNSSATRTFTLNNTGPVASTLSFAPLTGPYSYVGVCPTSIARNASVQFTVRFTPTNGDSAFESIRITSQDPVTPLYTIRMVGRGNLSILRADYSNGDTCRFPTTDINDSRNIVIHLQNLGNTATPLNYSTLTDGFSYTGSRPTTLGANSSDSVTVRFQPTTYGPHSSDLIVASNDPAAPSYTIHLSALCQGVAIQVTDNTDSSTYSFGDVNIGSAGTANFTLQNSGNASSTLAFATLHSQFTFVGTNPSTVADNGSTTFSVRYTPTTYGVVSDSIVITTQDGHNPVYKIYVTGNCHYSHVFADVANSDSTIFATTDLLDNRDVTVHLQNDGDQPSTLSYDALTNDFSFLSTPPSSIAAGGRDSLKVRFHPTSYGSHASTLRISSQDIRTPVYTIYLRAQCQGIAIQVSGYSDSSTYAFGSLIGGMVDSQTFTINNTGSSASTLSFASSSSQFSLIGAIPTQVAAYGSTTFTMRYQPLISGAVRDSLMITTQDGHNPVYKIYLTGTGIPISGTKTIGGTNPDYTNFTDAIFGLNSIGVGSGGVTFNIRSGSYAEMIALNTIPNCSQMNPVVFRKESGTVTLTPVATSATEAAVKLNGTDWVTFDGIDVADNSSGSNFIEYGYWLTNASATNGAQNITIQNCRIALHRQYASNGVYSRFSFNPTSTLGTQSNNKFYNLKITNCRSGIYLSGYNDEALSDAGNEVGSTNPSLSFADRLTIGGTDTVGGPGTGYGIYTSYQKDLAIHDIDISNIVTTDSYNATGLLLQFYFGTASVYRNRITGIRNITSNTDNMVVQGIFLNGYGTATNIPVFKIYNNMISDIVSSSQRSTATSSMCAIGIAAYSASGTFANNSILIKQDRYAARDTLAGSACITMRNGSFLTYDTLYNNILANISSDGNGSRHYCLFRSVTQLVSDNNNFYLSNSARGGYFGYSPSGDCNSLSSWQTSFSPNVDLNSTFGTPYFVNTESPIDLHIAYFETANPTRIESCGFPISWISTDIDGQSRHAQAPDIGADEGTFGGRSNFMILNNQADFGNVGESQSVDRSLLIANTGNAPLSIVYPAISGGFQYVGTPPTIIQHGVQTTFTVRFTSLGIGDHSITYQLSTNDPTHLSAPFRLIATSNFPIVAVNGYANRSTATFTSCRPGSASELEFYIKNSGTAASTLSYAALHTGYTFVGTPAATVAANDSIAVRISFSPTLNATYTDSLVITTQDQTNGRYVVKLTGTGLMPNITVRQVVNDGTSDYGTVSPYTNLDRTFTIVNTGNCSSTLAFTTLASSYTFVDSLPTTIAANDSAHFIVRFYPKTWGTKTDSVTITSQDLNDTTYKIHFTGAPSYLSGTLTLGGSNPNFTTFAEANTALCNLPLSTGGVVVSVRPGVFNEAVVVNTTLSTAAKPIIFRKESGSVTIVPPVTSSVEAAVKLVASKYVTFDGIDIVDQSTGTDFCEYGYWLTNTSTAGAIYNTIQNAKITLRAGKASSGIYTSYSVAINSQSLSNSYNKYLNLKITQAGNGIQLSPDNSSLNYRDIGNEIGSTTTGLDYVNRFQIGGPTVADSIGNALGTCYGIYSYEQEGLNIHDVDVRNMIVRGSTNNAYAIRSVYGYGATTVTRCRINNIKSVSPNQQPAFVYGIHMNASSASFRAIVTNNMIYDLAAKSTSTSPLSSSSYYVGGIVASSAVGLFAHNTVYLKTDYLNSSGSLYSSRCLSVQSSVDTVRNNIFVNASATQSSSVHAAIYSDVTTLVSDYNLYYSPNTNGSVGRFGNTMKTNLSDWQSAFTPAHDLHSIQANPKLVSTIDPQNLHVTQFSDSPVSNHGTLITGVTVDIDGETRNSSNPDIGADEGTFESITGSPTTLVASNVATTSVQLDWVDGSISEDYFHIFVSPTSFAANFDPTTATPIVQVVSSSSAEQGSVYNAVINNLIPNQTYYIRIYSAASATTLLSSGYLGNGDSTDQPDGNQSFEKSLKSTSTRHKSVVQSGASAKPNQSTDELNSYVYSTTYASLSFTTLAAVPAQPLVSAATANTVFLSILNNLSTPNSSSTQYAVRVNGNHFLTALGTMGTDTVWQTLIAWNCPKTVLALSPSTSYSFDVVARNSNNIRSLYSSVATQSTLAWTTNSTVYSPASGLLPSRYVDLDTISIPINVNLGSFQVVSNVEFFLSASHSYTGDVVFTLVAPDGTTDTLIARSGGSGDNFTDVIFKASADSSILTATPPFTGTWKPYCTFARLVGKPANGVWKFRAIDLRAGDSLRILSAQLSLHSIAPIITSPNPDLSQHPFVMITPPDPSTGGQPPVEIVFPTQTGSNGNPGSVTVNVVYSAPTLNPLQTPPENTISRTWEITPSSEQFTDATLTLRFTSADLPSGIGDPLTAMPPINAGYSLDGGNTWHFVPATRRVLVAPGVWEFTIEHLDHFSTWTLGNSGVLPVNLSSFSANVSSTGVNLLWITESEVNNNGFLIERRTDSTQYETIARITTQNGNSSTQLTYRWNDNRIVYNQRYQYRLSEISLEGIQTVLRVLSINTHYTDPEMPNGFAFLKSYPNPFNATMTVKVQLREAGEAKVALYSVTGQLVQTLFTGNLTSQARYIAVDGRQLASGTYILRISSRHFSTERKVVLLK